MQWQPLVTARRHAFDNRAQPGIESIDFVWNKARDLKKPLQQRRLTKQSLGSETKDKRFFIVMPPFLSCSCGPIVKNNTILHADKREQASLSSSLGLVALLSNAEKQDGCPMMKYW